VSVNSQVNISRKILYEEPSVNNPRNESPATNNFFPRIEFLNASSITGIYDRIIKLPTPVKSWHRASKGTVDRFKGCLSGVFPELKDLSEEDMKAIERKRHEL
jgi:hypothetical protein